MFKSFLTDWKKYRWLKKKNPNGKYFWLLLSNPDALNSLYIEEIHFQNLLDKGFR